MSHSEPATMRERRKNFRVEWNSAAKIYDCDGQFAALCIVSNFSNGGAKIIGLEPGMVPDEFILRISPRTRAQRCQVVRRLKDGLGVRFTDSAKSAGELALGGRQKSISKRSERYPEWA
jgi:PilZ domain